MPAGSLSAQSAPVLMSAALPGKYSTNLLVRVGDPSHSTPSLTSLLLLLYRAGSPANKPLVLELFYSVS